VISLHQYFKTRYQHSLFLCFIWITDLLWWTFHGFSKLLLIKSLYWFTGIFMTANLVCIIIFAESLEHDVKISLNLMLVLVLQSLIIIFVYDDKFVVIETYPNNEIGLRLNNPMVQMVAFCQMILSAMYALIVMTKIILTVPAIIKQKSIFALLGIVIFSSMGIFYVILGGDQFIPGLNMLFTFIGSLIFGFFFIKEPKIFHVLSFKMLRLQVIDIKSGIGVYSHTWQAGKEIGDETLLSGMVQGISMILQESVKRGSVEEIKLTKGILIIHRIPNSSIACVLVATKSTAPLRSALVNFAQKFNNRFSNKFNDICDLSVFDQTSELIAESFPFLWESIQKIN
jgi:hypothetical protein